MTDKPLAHEEALPLGDEAELTAAEYAFRLGDPRGVDDLRTIARRVAEVDDPLPEAIAAFRDALAREPTDEDLRDWTRALADELAKPDGNRNKVMARIRELARAIDKPSSRRDAAKQVLELLADNRPLIPAFPPDETPAARAWMLNRWLPEGRVSMFSGKQGWGKSHIALLLAAAVAGGAERWMRQETEDERAPDVQGGRGVAVWGSWEDEPDELWRRLAKVHASFGHPVDVGKRLHFLDLAQHGPLWAPNTKDGHISTRAEITPTGEGLRRYCEKAGARLLVIDPLSAAYLGDESAQGLVRSFMADWDGWSREHNVTTLFISHPPKYASDTGATFMGAVAWEAGARAAWFLNEAEQPLTPQEKKDNKEPSRALYLECVKTNYGPRPRRIWLAKDPEGLPHEVPPPEWAVGKRVYFEHSDQWPQEDRCPTENKNGAGAFAQQAVEEGFYDSMV